MRYIHFFLVGLSFSFMLYGVPYVKASVTARNITPVDSYFVSVSTQDGRRRFLAIGDFFDTTNGAYFSDSISYIEFAIPKLGKGEKFTKAYLDVYKYASDADGDVKVILRDADGSALIDDYTFDNGDYDFDKGRFDLSDVLGNYQGRNIKLSLSVDHPGYKEGVAVCSGSIEDGVCQSKYFPRLFFEIYTDDEPPHQPEIIDASEFGTREGVFFELKKQNEKVINKVKMCESWINDKCEGELAEAVSENERLNIISPVPLINEKVYAYIITSSDIFGNETVPLVVNITQKNDLPYIKNIRLAEQKLSPRNMDSVYDDLIVQYELSESMENISVEIVDGRGSIMLEKSISITTQDILHITGKQLSSLADGRYEIVFSGKDGRGYLLAKHKKYHFFIDNTAPKVYKVG